MEALHQDNLGWPWPTFVTLTHIYKKIFKGNISETTTATTTLSCAVIQLGMLLGTDGMCDFDLRKKGQNALTYFSVFRFQYADDLT